jgi:hypothetical protein
MLAHDDPTAVTTRRGQARAFDPSRGASANDHVEVASVTSRILILSVLREQRMMAASYETALPPVTESNTVTI